MRRAHAALDGQFRRDVKRAERRGKEMDKLKDVLARLIRQEPLPAKYLDHALRGDWKGYRDLHLEPDWLLIYRVDDSVLQLARTKTHADVFDQ